MLKPKKQKLVSTGLGMGAYELLNSQRQAKQAKQAKINAENELNKLTKGFPDTFKKKMR